MAAEGGYNGTDKLPASGSDPVAGAQSPRRIEDLLLEEKPLQDVATSQEQRRGGGGYGLRWPVLSLLLLAGVGAIGFLIYLLAAASFHDWSTVGASEEVRRAMPPRPHAGVVQERVTDDGAAAAEAIAMDAGAGDTDAAAGPGVDVPVPPQQEEAPVSVARAPAEQAAAAAPRYRVLVGPFLQQQELDEALRHLRAQGLQARSISGSGPVRMIRLLAGIYPQAAAEQHLQRLQAAAPSAFLLPAGDRWALYAASFHEQRRADALQEHLAARSITVTQVEVDLVMEGTLLVVLSTDEASAQEIARQIAATGLMVEVASDH